MVYTEYFVRGTEPRTFCPIHNAYESNASRVVATGGDDRPRPVPHEAEHERRPDDRKPDERRPVERQASTETVQPPGVTGGIVAPPTEAPKAKKPGFWGRIFKKQ